MYRVELSSRALKSLRRLPPDLGKRIIEGLKFLGVSHTGIGKALKLGKRILKQVTLPNCLLDE